jgi:hypothetical protein
MTTVTTAPRITDEMRQQWAQEDAAFEARILDATSEREKRAINTEWRKVLQVRRDFANGGLIADTLAKVNEIPQKQLELQAEFMRRYAQENPQQQESSQQELQLERLKARVENTLIAQFGDNWRQIFIRNGWNIPPLLR